MFITRWMRLCRAFWVDSLCLMFERCRNCGRRVLRGVRDQFGIFCSMVCRNNVVHPGFCEACIAATTTTSAGSTCSINGIGAVFYRARDTCKTCGSVIQSQWLCVFFIPIFRLGKFRVRYTEPSRYFKPTNPTAPRHYGCREWVGSSLLNI